MDQPVEQSQRDERFIKIFSVVAGILMSVLAVWIFSEIMSLTIKSL